MLCIVYTAVGYLSETEHKLSNSAFQGTLKSVKVQSNFVHKQVSGINSEDTVQAPVVICLYVISAKLYYLYSRYGLTKQNLVSYRRFVELRQYNFTGKLINFKFLPRLEAESIDDKYNLFFLAVRNVDPI